jgi:hypothetical protein
VLTAFYRFAVFRDAEAERCHAFRIRNAARTRSGLFFLGEPNFESPAFLNANGFSRWIARVRNKKCPDASRRGAGPEAWMISENDALAVPSDSM